MNPAKIIHIIGPGGDYYINLDQVDYIHIQGGVAHIHHRYHTLTFQLDPSAQNTLRNQLSIRSSATIVAHSPSPFTERGQGGEVPICAGERQGVRAKGGDPQ